MRSSLRLMLFSLAAALIAGCGFQLRGSYDLPYESLYLAMPDYSLVGAGLKRAIRASGSTRLADTPVDAQASFQPTGESRLPIILSLSSSGRVREKRLTYRFGYRIVDNKGQDLVLPVTVEISRDITYADSDVLAKTQEEDLLWRDMEKDLVQQLMRRLAAVKPVTPETLD
jgi:LPS-assembly lipoprotein